MREGRVVAENIGSRTRFNDEDAADLAAQVGARLRWKGKGSSRFAYFTSNSRFVVVAGAQEGTDVDLALAVGLTYRKDQRLTLLLPRGFEFPTLQRATWLKRAVRPHVFVHSGGKLTPCKMPAQEDTIKEFKRRLTKAQTLSDELRDATAPAYLGQRSNAVIELVDWATAHPLLDPSHRRSERSWHCLGQRVLSIKGTTKGIAVTAGIHYTKDEEKPEPAVVFQGAVLTARQLDQIQQSVQGGIHERLEGKLHRQDEHWLQAVIRNDPSLVGVEQPALREVPAWRPQGNVDRKKQWGRGFIDLLGVDGSGDIRLVETKLAANSDPMLIFQGLDYYVWSQAYLPVLKERLGTPKRAEVVVHYVIGAREDGSAHVNHFNKAQVDALDIPWAFQVVHDYFQADPLARPSGAHSDALPKGKMPGAIVESQDE
jgi:hypothetical protein